MLRPLSSDEMGPLGSTYFQGSESIPYPFLFTGASYREIVSGLDGLDLQAIDGERWWQPYSVKPNGQWKQKIGDDVRVKPAGTKKMVGPGGRKGLWTPEGYNVTSIIYLRVARRDDPGICSLLFKSVDMRPFREWMNRLDRLRYNGGKLPLWGSRWRWQLDEFEDDKGRILAGWKPMLLGVFGDGRPESPSEQEYIGARAVALGEASEMSTAVDGEIPSPPPLSLESQPELGEDDGREFAPLPPDAVQRELEPADDDIPF
jgi:hypothetical protein